MAVPGTQVRTMDGRAPLLRDAVLLGPRGSSKGVYVHRRRVRVQKERVLWGRRPSSPRRSISLDDLTNDGCAPSCCGSAPGVHGTSSTEGRPPSPMGRWLAIALAFAGALAVLWSVGTRGEGESAAPCEVPCDAPCDSPQQAVEATPSGEASAAAPPCAVPCSRPCSLPPSDGQTP